jgi:putative tricarboxylic transport membrane protein
MFDLLQHGFAVLADPKMLLLVVLAVMLGTLFGALPGVSGTMAVTLGIPFTYNMPPVQSVVFLVAIYCASITGGGMTAILFKIPGVPSSAPTTYDGYPMAQRGEAGKALGIQLVSSAIGGLFAATCMLLLCGPLTKVAVSFGPAELFAIAFLGLSILTSLDTNNICRTIISGLIGLLLACVGLDPLLGVPRMTFGFRSLNSGFEMIPIMIGFFAITEVLKQTVKRTQLNAVDEVKQMKTVFPSLRELFETKWVMFRCAVLGTIVGILPGAGATIAAFLCYSTEQKLSKHPEKFGTGCIDGIVAPETANNAATGGSMVPLLSLGIPGGNAAAIMMSALVLKGVQMGPMLLVKQPEFLGATFVSMIFANITMVFAAMLLAKIFVQILRIPYSILGPMIIMMATIGAFASNSIGEDVITMGIAGVIGFVIIVCKFDISAMILGLVLGPICESNIRRAYSIAAADGLWDTTWKVFSQPLKDVPIPLTAIMIVICFLVLASPGLKKLWNKRKVARK